jgi:kinesin family protein 6/9
MVKQAVKVVIRTRPTSNFASKNMNVDVNNGTISMGIPKNEAGGVINN